MAMVLGCGSPIYPNVINKLTQTMIPATIRKKIKHPTISQLNSPNISAIGQLYHQ
jgi:hypothetical protein